MSSDIHQTKVNLDREDLLSMQNYYFVMHFLSRFLSRWKMIGCCCFLTIFASLGAAHLFPAQYESKMIIFPKNVLNRGGASSISSSLSLLSATLNSQSNGLYMLVKVIGTERLAARLIKSGDFIQIIYRNQWDETTRSWHPPKSLGSTLKRFFSRIAGIQPWHQPDESDLAKFLDSSINANFDKQSNSLTLTLVQSDPKFARRLLNAAYRNAEELLIADELMRSEARLNYYRAQLSSVTDENGRSVLFNAINQEYAEVLLLKGSGNVFTEPVQDATLPTTPSAPKLAIFLVFGVVSGLALSVLLFFWDPAFLSRGFESKRAEVEDTPDQLSSW